MIGVQDHLAPVLDHARQALEAAAREPSAASLGVLTLAVLSLHGRVARRLATLPDVAGDDVPWAAIGDRELYASAVVGALTVQRGRIAALTDLRDTEGLLESCRLSLQTLGGVVRDLERVFPATARPARLPRAQVHKRRVTSSMPTGPTPSGRVRLRVVVPAA
jgi:hypothetical protein